MKGNVLDFLKLADEKPELAQKLVDLAAEYGFEFSDAVTDEELEKWKQRDPIRLLEQRLLGDKVMSEMEIESVHAGATAGRTSWSSGVVMYSRTAGSPAPKPA